MKASNLVKEFKKAGLELKVLDKPIRSGRGMDQIVQIDVGRKSQGNRRDEWFNMYLGEDNEVQIRNMDMKSKQLVLMVKEAEREFEETIYHPTWAHDGNEDFDTWAKNMQRVNNARVVKKVKNPDRGQSYIVIKRKTSSDVRYFLMGVDERQLFMAQLTRPATTVREARESLGSSVKFAEGSRRGSSVDRQGEWFFLETSQGQRDVIEKLIKDNKVVIHSKTSIGSHAGRAGGNPHTADELIVVANNKHTAFNEKVAALLFPAQQRQKVFVRGGIRHVDHKTVKFAQWREVIANNEGDTARGASEGMFWVD